MKAKALVRSAPCPYLAGLESQLCPPPECSVPATPAPCCSLKVSGWWNQLHHLCACCSLCLGLPSLLLWLLLLLPTNMPPRRSPKEPPTQVSTTPGPSVTLTVLISSTKGASVLFIHVFAHFFSVSPSGAHGPCLSCSLCPEPSTGPGT